ncbi:MAG TPA: GNAT family N-acetyltransferase [Ignavibacteria bacterium]|nr:GNAT family N-acetyltransferase [Ignavibacteria bacterium]
MILKNKNIGLSVTKEKDLDVLFEIQSDEKGIYLAAFTPKNPHDKTAFIEKYKKLLSDPTINMRTIIVDDLIIGSISKFIMEDESEITYWIDRKYWGMGVATYTLKSFLEIEETRPIFGRVAFDNIGSQKVLEKNGFVKVGTDNGFANARQKEIEEYIYKLVE